MSVVLTDLHGGYTRDVSILNGVSLEVPEGSIVTILGPNGSGKSTLLRAIMGYLPHLSGSVQVDGAELRDARVHDRAVSHGLAYVPQVNNVFGPLTVRQNLEVGGARIAVRERRKRIAELLEVYPQLADRLGQRADTQSGGERQMLAIARALMTRPRYILLDEPSAGLSPLMLERLFDMLGELRRQEDLTILIVEQNAAQSLRISDSGLVLVFGKVAMHGTGTELLADSRVAELYLGGGADLGSATPTGG